MDLDGAPGAATRWRRDDPLAAWASPSPLRAEADAWVRTSLAAQGTQVRGPLRPHRLRFWSAVLTTETDRGRVWFKATNPGQAFEPALLAVLARLVPDDVVVPLAVDAARGWALLPDGGATWRERGAGVDDWAALLAQVAAVQQTLCGAGTDLAAAGLPRLLPEEGAAYVRDLVSTLAALPPADPQHVDAPTARALHAAVPRLEDALALLAATGVPPTLQPNDVSTGNAFAPRGPEGRARLFDLGDAFWSHPFAVLQVPLRFATGAWPGPPAPDDPVAAWLRDAYLAAWSGDLRGVDALRAVDAADRLASLHRCESWRRLLRWVDAAAVPAPVPRLATWLADALRVGPAGR